MQFFLFLALIIALALVLFAVQNSTVITLTFIKWTFDGSLAFILALTFAIGILTGIFLFIPTWWRNAKKGRSQRKRIQELEREVLDIAEHGVKTESDEHGEETF
jgi:putative membrane protein